MKIVCIGDSLTEGDHGVFGSNWGGNIKAENYPFFLSQILGVEVVNCGKCGFRSSDYLKYYQDGNATVTGADAVIVMLGTNGGMEPDADTPDNTAYEKLLKLIKTDAPQAKIVLCTPPHATENPASPTYGHAPQVKQAVKYVRSLCEKQGYPLIDLATCPEFTAENEPIMQPNDGLHYGEAGYKVMAQFIADGLKQLKIV